MRHRSESGSGSESRQCFAGKDFGWPFSGEDELGIGNRLFSRHVPGIERVHDGDQREADDDDDGVFGEVFEQDAEARMQAGRCSVALWCGRGFRQGIEEREESKDRKEQNGGKLGQFGQAEETSG